VEATEDKGSMPESDPGTLLTRPTVDVYVNDVVELYMVQVADGMNFHPHPCRFGLSGLLKKHARQGETRTTTRRRRTTVTVLAAAKSMQTRISYTCRTFLVRHNIDHPHVCLSFVPCRKFDLPHD
jgi:hypothetical protein